MSSIKGASPRPHQLREEGSPWAGFVSPSGAVKNSCDVRPSAPKEKCWSFRKLATCVQHRQHTIRIGIPASLLHVGHLALQTKPKGRVRGLRNRLSRTWSHLQRPQRDPRSFLCSTTVIITLHPPQINEVELRQNGPASADSRSGECGSEQAISVTHIGLPQQAEFSLVSGGYLHSASSQDSPSGWTYYVHWPLTQIRCPAAKYSVPVQVIPKLLEINTPRKVACIASRIIVTWGPWSRRIASICIHT